MASPPIATQCPDALQEIALSGGVPDGTASDSQDTPPSVEMMAVPETSTAKLGVVADPTATHSEAFGHEIATNDPMPLGTGRVSHVAPPSSVETISTPGGSEKPKSATPTATHRLAVAHEMSVSVSTPTGTC
jgi:hypothetical protein